MDKSAAFKVLALAIMASCWLVAACDQGALAPSGKANRSEVGRDANTDAGAGVTYEEAQRLPKNDLTARVLAQFGATVVEVQRPRPGLTDPLRLATRPAPSYPGMCETQFIDVDFAVKTQGPDKYVAGRSEVLSMSRAYHVVGNLE